MFALMVYIVYGIRILPITAFLVNIKIRECMGLDCCEDEVVTFLIQRLQTFLFLSRF